MFRGSPTDWPRMPVFSDFSGWSRKNSSRLIRRVGGSTSPPSSNALAEAGRKVARLLCEQTASQCTSPPSTSNPVPVGPPDFTEPCKSDRWRPATGRSPSKRHGTLARDAGGSFSPNRPRQGLDHRGYSPTMRAILVAMAIAARSFAEAAKLAGIAAELKISPRHLQTLCQEQGGIGIDEQTERTTAYKDRPLMTPTTAANPPIELAAVMIDGGRIPVRQPDHGPGVHEPAWRETKTAVLLRMKRQVSDVDPQPNLPTCFAGPLGSAVSCHRRVNRRPRPRNRTGDRSRWSAPGWPP